MLDILLQLIRKLNDPTKDMKENCLSLHEKGKHRFKKNLPQSRKEERQNTNILVPRRLRTVEGSCRLGPASFSKAFLNVDR